MDKYIKIAYKNINYFLFVIFHNKIFHFIKIQDFVYTQLASKILYNLT